MGDRTWVTISIHKSNFKHNLKLEDFPEQPCDGKEDLENKDTEIISLGFDEVNYGISDPLIDFLCDKKVDFNYRWESGCEYGAGERYYRYCSKMKEMTYDEFYDESMSLIHLLKELDKASSVERDNIIEKKLKEYCQNNFDEELKPCQKEKFIEALKESSNE